MALLQIAEPGQSAAPHQHRLAAGIDLGTTNSLIATVQSAVPRALADEEGIMLLPSVVRYLPGNGVVVGREAQHSQAEDPENTIVSVKRFMGRSLSDLKDATCLPYRFTDAPGMVGISTVSGERSPVQVSAEILTALRERAETSLGGPLAGVVITVPAYFDDAQRQATKDAARLADARKVIDDAMLRSDSDARLLAELARRLLAREHLHSQYAESRDYVATLRRDLRSDL